MGMHGDQHFLQKVLCLCWTMPNACEAMAIVGAQMPRQLLEECVVRGAIAFECYAPDSGVDKPHGTASMAKALVGGMSLAIALSAATIGYLIGLLIAPIGTVPIG